MDQCVNEQMATCNHAEKLAVDHMCDPGEWMPVCLVKSGERPGESRERNAAIHHRVFLDIRIVIQSDELMPHHLRINPKCYYRQTEQDEKVGSLEGCNAADLAGCGKADSFSLLRAPFSHTLSARTGECFQFRNCLSQLDLAHARRMTERKAISGLPSPRRELARDPPSQRFDAASTPAAAAIDCLHNPL